jgi:hypothetical protein
VTKVEELRERMKQLLFTSDLSIEEQCTRVYVLGELIVASHASGVAEERERIRGESQMVGVNEDGIVFIGSIDNYIGAAFLVPVDVMDPPPVLAPDKEGK